MCILASLVNINVHACVYIYIYMCIHKDMRTKACICTQTYIEIAIEKLAACRLMNHLHLTLDVHKAMYA